jgi:TPP-dependent indolepyruvate ferredoxin oxidoreductase alpha subunit
MVRGVIDCALAFFGTIWTVQERIETKQSRMTPGLPQIHTTKYAARSRYKKVAALNPDANREPGICHGCMGSPDFCHVAFAPADDPLGMPDGDTGD